MRSAYKYVTNEIPYGFLVLYGKWPDSYLLTDLVFRNSSLTYVQRTSMYRLFFPSFNSIRFNTLNTVAVVVIQ